MTILVCGGAGYIGSHMVAALLEKNHQAIVVDNLSVGHKAAIWPGAKFYEGDIRDSQFLAKVFSENKIDAVANFAACTQVKESMENPAKYYSNNITGMITLLEQMLAHNVKKFIFSSSASVYGLTDRLPISEDEATNPISPYAETKLAGEKILKWYDNAYGIKYTAFRYFNVGGAHESAKIGEDHDPESHLIPICIHAAQGKIPIFQIYGDDYNTHDGTNVRDYVHVMDLVDAHILALEKMGDTSAIYNLSSQNGFSNKEIIAAVKKVTGIDFPVKVGERRPGDPDASFASSDKIRQELGWKPSRTNIEEIVASAWAWHNAYPEGYGDK